MTKHVLKLRSLQLCRLRQRRSDVKLSFFNVVLLVPFFFFSKETEKLIKLTLALLCGGNVAQVVNTVGLFSLNYSTGEVIFASCCTINFIYLFKDNSLFTCLKTMGGFHQAAFPNSSPGVPIKGVTGV